MNQKSGPTGSDPSRGDSRDDTNDPSGAQSNTRSKGKGASRQGTKDAAGGQAARADNAGQRQQSSDAPKADADVAKDRRAPATTPEKSSDSDRGATSESADASAAGKRTEAPTASNQASKPASSEATRSTTASNNERTGASESQSSSRAQAASAGSSAGAGRGGRKSTTGGGANGRDGNGGDGVSRSLLVAVVAAVIAVIAILLAAWSLYSANQQSAQAAQRAQEAENTLKNSVNKTLQNKIEPRLQRLSQNVQKHVKKRDQALEKMRHTVQTIKKRDAKLAKEINGSTHQWQLQRVESLLAAANRAIQLDQDPQTAIKALGLADHRLAGMNDPSVFDLRQTIAKEQSKLQALPNPDITGIAIKLGNAASNVSQLALASDVPKRFERSKNAGKSGNQSGNKSTGQTNDDGWLRAIANGTQRAVDKTGQALSSLVTIRRSDSPPPTMLPPDRAAYLGQNLALDLRTARLALLNKQSDVYQQNLKDAIGLLNQYFDTGNDGVSSLIKQLQQLSNIKLASKMPDISASMATVRQMIESKGSSSTSDNGSGSGSGSGQEDSNSQSKSPQTGSNQKSGGSKGGQSNNANDSKQGQSTDKGGS